MKYIIFLLLLAYSRADQNGLSGLINRAHKTIGESNYAMQKMINMLSANTARTILLEHKQSLTDAADAFAKLLRRYDQTYIESFVDTVAEELPVSVKAMFGDDNRGVSAQTIGQQFIQAVRAYINVPSSAFQSYKDDNSSLGKSSMESLAIKALREALSELNNLEQALKSRVSR